MIRFAAAAVLLGFLSGCSSLADRSAEASGHLLGRLGEATYPVKVSKLDGKGKLWQLEQQYDEPPVLDGFQMDYRARSLCSQGYLKEDVYAVAPRKLADDHAACLSADCRYTLVWKIRCEQMPQAPFSIFGKF
jgi:hypothetical protein